MVIFPFASTAVFIKRFTGLIIDRCSPSASLILSKQFRCTAMVHISLGEAGLASGRDLLDLQNHVCKRAYVSSQLSTLKLYRIYVWCSVRQTGIDLSDYVFLQELFHQINIIL